MDIKYEELKRLHSQYFGFYHLNISLNEKFAVIAMICSIVNELKKKKPDITYYEIVNKLCSNKGFDKDFIWGLSIVCEDFGIDAKEIPNFGIKVAEMPKKVSELLNNYLPF